MTTDTTNEIEYYRRMTGEQRLLVGLRLHELECEIARENIRAIFPYADNSQVEEKLRERILFSHKLNSDDAETLLRNGILPPSIL